MFSIPFNSHVESWRYKKKKKTRKEWQKLNLLLINITGEQLITHQKKMIGKIWEK